MSEERFEKTFTVRWADLDSNGHMANTAYLDVCVDVRLGYLAERGVAPRDLKEFGIGPVVRRDEVDYFRELRLGESYFVDYELAGASGELSRFRIRNRFRNEAGDPVAEVVSTGGWFDHESRELVTPPEKLRKALLSLPRSDDFEELAPSVRGPD
ncbi:MAG: thioesterase family protein [Thermoanaerobaculia bacterium]|nr:thioesterase family protein [Thermoanaerobaculia bacterium]